MIKRLSSLLAIAAVLTMPSLASAHVTVKPTLISPAEFTTFTVSVPNEKSMNVSQVTLTIPGNLKYVTPTVKPGWTIATEKSGDGESALVSNIRWTDGIIAPGFRDEFTFSAQTPAKPTDLQWKAYQTYEDGTTVSWDQPLAAAETSDGSRGPFSVTNVVKDAETASATDTPPTSNTLPLILSSLALLVSVGGVLFRTKS